MEDIKPASFSITQIRRAESRATYLHTGLRQIQTHCELLSKRKNIDIRNKYERAGKEVTEIKEKTRDLQAAVWKQSSVLSAPIFIIIFFLLSTIKDESRFDPNQQQQQQPHSTLARRKTPQPYSILSVTNG